jgi:hypothetical protein
VSLEKLTTLVLLISEGVVDAELRFTQFVPSPLYYVIVWAGLLVHGRVIVLVVHCMWEIS